MRIYIFAIALGLIIGFCHPPSVPADVYATPTGDISINPCFALGGSRCADSIKLRAADLADGPLGLPCLPPSAPAIDLNLYSALYAFTLANGHHQRDGSPLSEAEATSFAGACMLWPDPAWACAMGMAESGGDSGAVNRSSGATGWWQLLGHRKSMAKMGLDFDNEADRTWFAIYELYGSEHHKGPWAASRSGTAKWLRELNKYIEEQGQ